MKLVVRTTPLDADAPLLDFLPDRDALAFVRGEAGLVGWGEAARLSPGTGGDRFARAEDWVATLAQDAEIVDEVGLPGCGLAAFVSFTFDDRAPGSRLVVPSTIVGRHDGTTWVTQIGARGAELAATQVEARPIDTTPLERPRYAGASIPDLLWLEAVASAVRRIEAGELEKVVLARDHAVWAKAPFDVRRLVGRLHQRFPGCFTFVIDGLVGATPELLVRRIGDRVQSVTLAGSVRRGATPEEDEALGAQLLESEKDRWEHALAVRSVEAVLAPRTTDLDVPASPQLLRLDNVQHLATPFEGTLDEPTGALALAAALHPTAAVGGAPTDTAIDAIRELEHMDRGRYAAPVGWVDHNGDGEFGIALRCAELSGARARLFAGAGIVDGSLPEDELEETRVKLLAMQSAFAD